MRSCWRAWLLIPWVGMVMAAEPATEDEAPAAAHAMADRERTLALAANGDAVNGKDAYEICSACHLPSAGGKANGGPPKLAGQHPRVLIKQITDIRAEVRKNPIMHNFVLELRDPQEIADVAAYVSSLCVPRGNGRYVEADAPLQMAEGRRLYENVCIDCHMSNGEGDAAKGYPVLAGQHYRYLLRQMTNIRDGLRRNVDTDMYKIIRKHTNEKLQSLAAYMASLETPGRVCTQQAGRN